MSDSPDTLSPDLLDRIFRINPEPMALTRLNSGQYVDVNESFLKTFGYARHEIIGHTADEIGIWQDVERDRGEIVRQIQERGYAADIEASFCTRTGGEVRFLLGATRIEAEGGALLLIVGRNITALRESEAALRQSEARFRGFIEHLPLGVLIAQDGFIRFANPASLEMIDYTLDEVLGESFLQMVHEEDREMLMTLHQRRMQGDEADFCYDLRVLRKGGEVCYWRVHASASSWEGRMAGLVVCADVTQQKLSEQRMTDLALHDQITGLPNRTLLADHARRAMTLTAKGFAVIYLDLDGFKAVNDRYGHNAGDLVLKEVAHRLRTSTRETDTAARVGGDEFVVLIRDVDDCRKAMQVAEHIRLVINRPIKAAETQHRVGASIGVSLYPADGRNLECLIRLADEAMYRAKRGGRNRVCCSGDGDIAES
jgi:diguanylate cyclase (GGDEF)-like protein/PAS domain S-box-containing protein